jgi:hypothetical protein
MEGNTDESYDDIPELGDYVTFISDVFKSVTGIIIYRDGDLIRIRPLNSTLTAVDFPLDPETGLFQESLGLSEVIIHKKRSYPHFSKQLGVLPGEQIEFLDASGTQVEPSATVFEVISSETEDAIKFTDGRVLDFQFLGVPPPYVRLNARAVPEMLAEPENNTTLELPEEEPYIEQFPDIDEALLPAAMVEEIPSEERTYSDSVQREAMFVSLLTDHPLKRQKDPKVMSQIYRITDLLLSLKNSVLRRDETGAPLVGAEPIKYTVDTLQSILDKHNGAPLSTFLPIAAIKKVLYCDVPETKSYTDVEARNDTKSLVESLNAATTFSIDRETQGNPFITYIHDLLEISDVYKIMDDVNEPKKTIADQDVLRTRAPPDLIQGFSNIGPAFVKGNPVEVNELAIGSIETRTARLLSASRIKNTKTDTVYVVAPADPASTINYLVLDNSISFYRNPIRSSNLLWDIQRSEAERKSKQPFYAALQSRLNLQRILNNDDLLLSELQERVEPSLTINSRGITTVLDSLGLRNLELTEQQFMPIKNALEKGQSVWNGAYLSLGAAAVTRLKNVSQPVIAPITTTLYDDTFFQNKILQKILTTIKEKESTFKNYDILYASEFQTNANGTLFPLVNGILANINNDILDSVFQAWKNESARTQRITENMRFSAKLLQAVPELNPCKHVKELDKIRSIQDLSKRMILLDKFLKRYSSGQKGNYMLCGQCNKELICRHEILLMNEYFNPGRSSALHKALLLEFAGPVFEGASICKNCGQKIKEIEYDTHIEFDDEGRPLMGRTVLEVEEDDSGVAISEEAIQEIPFKDVQRKYYFYIRTLFELCGLALNLDVYQRVVNAIDKYSQKYIITEEAYKASQARQQVAAERTGKRFFNVPYPNWQSTELIRVCGALTVLELQTNPINVPIAAPGCELSRNGFPLDGIDPKTTGTGCVDYVACALASIKRTDTPWSKLLWSAETDMKRRISASKQAIMFGLAKIIAVPIEGMPSLVPLDDITQIYRDLLDTTRKRTTENINAVNTNLASSADKLPPVFRPLPYIKESNDSEQIANVKRFQENLEKGEYKTMRTITLNRLTNINNNLMSEFHKNAKIYGIVQTNNPCSESVCCKIKLSVLSLKGNGLDSLTLQENILAEAKLIQDAAEKLKRRDSVAPNAGTHIYVPWKAPVFINVLPTPDSSTYYKLFLKNCHSGKKYGQPHEYSDDYVCRNCLFVYPQELIYLIPALISESNGKKYEAALKEQEKERETYALAAFQTQNIVINEDSFRSMEDAIKKTRFIQPSIQLNVTPFFTVLENISIIIQNCDKTISDDWASLINGMSKIQKDNLIGGRRLAPLVDFTRRYDVLVDKLKTALTSHSSVSSRPRLPNALNNIISMTQNISSLVTHFVCGATQIATTYKIRKIPVTKWIPKINREHIETLTNIWEVFGKVGNESSLMLEELEDDLRNVIKNTLLRFSSTLGPVLKIWQNSLRPTIGFTPDEYKQALQWNVISLLFQTINPTSIWYGDSPSLTLTAKACTFISDWILLTATAGYNIQKKYVLSSDDIRSEVYARTEREKAMFIAKMDRQEQEMRKLELVKKKLKIGDWSVGSKNLFKYNADMYEFERSQRAAMGLPEFTEDITGVVETEAETDEFGAITHGMEEGILHRAGEDEDETEGGVAGRIYNIC